MTPRAVLLLLAFTMVMSFGIGAVFAWYGAWMVLPFAGIEMAGLAAAFLLNGMHASDYERFSFGAGSMVVEIRDGKRLERHEFNPHWVRLVMRKGRRDLTLALASRGEELRVGRHLDRAGRELFARELNGRIVTARVAPGAVAG